MNYLDNFVFILSNYYKFVYKLAYKYHHGFRLPL